MAQNIHDGDAKKKVWQNSVELRFRRIDHVLQKILPEYNEDRIHDFRVEIKKLKALVHLFSFSMPFASNTKFPKPLDKLYKSLGSLRKWQIQKKNISKAAGDMHYVNPLTYKNKIDRKTETCKRRARELIRQLHDLKKIRDKVKKKCPGELSLTSISAFIQTKMGVIQSTLQSGVYDDEVMHDMRKKLKDVQYILSGSKKKEETNQHIARLKSVNSVSGQLGDFHDLCIALKLLNQEIKMLHKETSEKKLFRKIKDKWLAEKVQLREQTIQSTQALILHHFPEVCTN